MFSHKAKVSARRACARPVISTALFALIATLSGCGSPDTTDSKSFLSLDTRGYLVSASSTDFSQTSIADSVEVVSAGTASYQVRFLLDSDLADDEEIDVLAGTPVSSTPQTIFVIKPSDLTKGSNGDDWTALNLTQVAAPLVPTSLLVTQVRSAAEKGNWQFQRKKSGTLVASGFLLPDSDIPLSVTVPDTSQGLSQGVAAFGSMEAKAQGIDVSATLPIADANAFGTVQDASLDVLSSTAAGASTVYSAPLTFVQSSSQLTVTSAAGLHALANDLSPTFDTAIKYLTVGIQRGNGVLRLHVRRNGSTQEILLNVGITQP